MSQPFTLSIQPLTPAEIPSEDEILNAATQIVESISSWKKGKSFYNQTVHTYSRSRESNGKNHAGWYSRVSEHTAEDATFDQFWDKLGHNKAENEMQYVEEIKEVKLIKEISPTMAIWTLYYHFGPVVSPRVFTVLQVKRFSQGNPRKFLIASIPIDLSSPGDEELAKLERKAVRGRYCSVEQVQELPDGKVEWKMATSSTPGGNIPQLLAESTMAGKISEDVPNFLKWIHSL